jgi:hypothetical protein
MPRARTRSTRSTGIARRVRRRRAPADTGGAEVVIRSAAPADEAEIDRLSKLDDHALPHGECLIGELEGRVVAALDVGSGEAIADPFVATAALVELLGLRAAQVRR